jgi:V/A-type H+-transporting ATPase subunit C
MKSPKTIYLIARTHGLQEHLLRSEQFVQLLMLKDALGMYDFLLKTEYSKELSKIPVKELDAYRLEKIFYQKLSQRFFFLLQITSGKTKQILEHYCRKIEVENLKRVTRAIHAKEKISEDQLIPIPRKYQTINFPALLQSHTIREMIELLRESEYENLRKAIDIYEKYENPRIIEAEADKTYYELLWKKLEKAINKDEVRDLIGTEIDLKNLLTVFTLKYTKVEQKLLQQTVINIYHRLSKSFIKQAPALSYQAIPELLTWPKYVELAKKAVELMDKGMMSKTENLFSQYLYSYAETTALRNSNNLVYVFAYLELCFREARNLTTLAIGKQLRLEDEKIKSLLSL